MHGKETYPFRRNQDFGDWYRNLQIYEEKTLRQHHLHHPEQEIKEMIKVHLKILGMLLLVSTRKHFGMYN